MNTFRGASPGLSISIGLVQSHSPYYEFNGSIFKYFCARINRWADPEALVLGLIQDYAVQKKGLPCPVLPGHSYHADPLLYPTQKLRRLAAYLKPYSLSRYLDGTYRYADHT